MNRVLNYTEDSGPILLIPENLQSGFFFTGGEGSNVGYRVTLTIVTGSNDDPGQLILPNDFSAPSNVSVRGVNSSEIIVEFSTMFSNYIPLDSFTAVFRAVRILFIDQAPRRYLALFL